MWSKNLLKCTGPYVSTGPFELQITDIYFQDETFDV